MPTKFFPPAETAAVIARNHERFGTPAEQIRTLQIQIETMIGGGLLARFAICQPADFYIDTRVGKLPYSAKKIGHSVQLLAELAKLHGLDPHNLPEMQPATSNLGWVD